MRLTFHNGRIPNSTADHNDRRFDVSKSDSIDISRTRQNVYWNWISGFDELEQIDTSFKECERIFYANKFDSMIADINSRAEQQRHPERRTDVLKLLSSKKTMPEETIIQLGNVTAKCDVNVLIDVFNRFLTWHNKKFGNNIEILDCALHLDETTEHIHVRKVYHYTDDDGIVKIGQNKALEKLGYRLKGSRNRYNNVKIEYTAECREKLLELCKEHNLSIEDPVQNRKHQNLKTNEFILEKQNEQIQANTEIIQQQMLEIGLLKEELKRKRAFDAVADEVVKNMESSIELLNKGLISPNFEPNREELNKNMIKANKALKTRNKTISGLSKKRKPSEFDR